MIELCRWETLCGQPWAAKCKAHCIGNVSMSKIKQSFIYGQPRSTVHQTGAIKSASQEDFIFIRVSQGIIHRAIKQVSKCK